MKTKILVLSLFFFIVYQAQSFVVATNNESSNFYKNKIQIANPLVIESDASSEDTIVYSDRSLTIKPEFPGGNEAFNAHVNIFVKKDNNKKHDVFITFIVEKTGELSNIKIFRGLEATTSEATDEEIIAIVQKSPRWKPGELSGKKVRCMVPLFLTIDGKY